jgi:hypothetical protein
MEKNLKKYSNPAILVTPQSTKLFLTPVSFNYEATGWLKYFNHRLASMVVVSAERFTKNYFEKKDDSY